MDTTIRQPMEAYPNFLLLLDYTPSERLLFRFKLKHFTHLAIPFYIFLNKYNERYIIGALVVVSLLPWENYLVFAIQHAIL